MESRPIRLGTTPVSNSGWAVSLLTARGRTADRRRNRENLKPAPIGRFIEFLLRAGFSFTPSYAAAPVNDLVAWLGRDLDAEKVHLRYDRAKGYLPALLEALGVPVESQMLVFSKTSFQASRINATSPRAIYFSDRVAVGFVHGGEVLELAAQDPRQGTVFYTLDQDPAPAPSFARRDDACLQCHLNGATSDVPGLVIRSVYPEPSGMPLFQAGGFVSDHRSPIKQRWGGWFVTGQHGSQRHMGNAFVRDRQNPSELDTSDSLNRRELPLMVRRDYLSPPDIVALLVAEHQFRAMNLITRLNFETRLALHQRDLMARVFGGPSAESAASPSGASGSRPMSCWSTFCS